MICTPVLASLTADLIPAMIAAAEVADWIELRLDYLADFDDARPETTLADVLKVQTKPVILTFRPKEQGGARELSPETRERFWRAAVNLDAAAFDIEYDLYPAIAAALPDDHPARAKIIVSRHDFEKTPDNLADFCRETFPADARRVKLATKANDTGDTRRLFEQLQRFIEEGREPIVIGMGMAGSLTRTLAPAHGGRLTYSAALDGTPSAPGQFSADELRTLFRVGQTSSETVVAGIIGNPVTHSISKFIHNAAFQALGLDWVYVPVEVQPDGGDLGNFISDFVHPKTKRIPWRVGGYSVTIPHKIAVMEFLDRLTPTAQAVGAVNTIIVEGDELVGHNTDIHGAMIPLERRFPLQNSRIAVLGAGGAAHSVVCGLVERGAQVTVFVRDVEKAQAFGGKFGVEILSIDAFDGTNFTGLVNTTPVGMRGFSDDSPVPIGKLGGLQWVYDLIYKPRVTTILREAETRGIATLGGLDMLIEQAALQFQAWTGMTSPPEVMRQAAEKHF
jgi:3-dehydroquinate dehydratase / shikimate dehydrogenase